MTYIVITLIIIVFIVYYLERFHAPSLPKENEVTKKESLTLTPDDIQNIYTNKNQPTYAKPDKEHIQPPQHLVDLMIASKEQSPPEDNMRIEPIIQSIPPPHPMLLSITSGEMKYSEKLYELIKKDAEITGVILQAVNASGFYVTQKITSLNQAILYLGTNTVRNIALQYIIRSQAAKEEPQLVLAFNKIWSTAFLASSLTFLFAKNLEFKNTSELATQTLLAYIGNLAILSYKPNLAYCFTESLSLFERVQAEQEALGVNSALVGSELAVLWQLPPSIIDSIKTNLIPLNTPPQDCSIPESSLRNVVLCYASCRLAEEIINKGKKDIGEINLLNTEQIELFYLTEYIYKTHLNGLLFLLKKPFFCREANKLIEKMAGFHSEDPTAKTV